MGALVGEALPGFPEPGPELPFSGFPGTAPVPETPHGDGHSDRRHDVGRTLATGIAYNRYLRYIYRDGTPLILEKERGRVSVHWFVVTSPLFAWLCWPTEVLARLISRRSESTS